MKHGNPLNLYRQSPWILIVLLLPSYAAASNRLGYIEYDKSESHAYWNNFFLDRSYDEVYHQSPFYSGYIELPLVASGDINNDGITDFVSADLYGQMVLIMLGLGRELGYSVGKVILDTKAVASVQLADLDLDGNQDLIVTGRLTGTEDMAILYGDGRGGFTKLVRLQAHTAPIGTFTFKRFTDRRPWLCCVNYRSRDLDIYEPKGLQDYDRRDRINFGPYPNAVVKSVDSKSSISTLTAFSRDDLSIWQVRIKPKGNPVAEREPPFSLRGIPHALSLFPDIIQPTDAKDGQNAAPEAASGIPLLGFGNGLWSGQVRAFQPFGPGEFRTAAGIAAPRGADGEERVPIRVIAADFLGDGKNEIVAVYAKQKYLKTKVLGYWRPIHDTDWLLFQQQEDGSWEIIAQSMGFEMPTNMIAADLDGNGIKDLIYGYYPHGNMLVWRPFVRTRDGYAMMRERTFPLEGIKRIRISADAVVTTSDRRMPYEEVFKRMQIERGRVKPRQR